MAENKNKEMEDQQTQSVDTETAAIQDAQSPVAAEAEMPAGPTMRQRLRERFKKRYKEDDYESDEDGELLGGRIMSQLDENEAALDKYREKDSKLRDMFVGNPSTARFFTRWGAGEDPLNLFAEIFGDKLRETLDSPDAEQKMKSGMQKYFDNIKRNKDAEEEFQNNSEQTLAMIQERTDKGASFDEMKSAIDLLTGMAVDLVVGKVTPETLDIVLKAVNHDKNVTNAREEGLAAGRNERYQEKMRQRQKGDGQPAAASGSTQRANPDRQVSRPGEGRRSAWDADEKRVTW